MNPIRRIADVIFVGIVLGALLFCPQSALLVIPIAIVAWGLTLIAGTFEGKASATLLVLGTSLLVLLLLACSLLAGASPGDTVTMPLFFGDVGAI